MAKAKKKKPVFCWIQGPQTTYGQLPDEADYTLPGEECHHYNKFARDPSTPADEAARQDTTVVIPLYMVTE